MFIDALFLAGLALAQPPSAAPAFIPQPMIAAPARLAPVGQAPMNPMPAGQPAPAAPAAVWTEAPAAPEQPKFLAERILEGTRIGDMLTERGIRVYGWTQMSWSFGSAEQNNAPLQFVDRAREFLINQVNVRVEKPIDPTKNEFQLGFFSDSFIGTDARHTIIRGLNEYQLRKGYLYPYDAFQSYGIAYLPGIGQGTTVKIGRFATHCSYETVDPTTTPFLTRAYTFQFNPYTHTGVYASTQVSDALTVNYGMAFGSDVFVDPAARLTFIGGFKIAPKDGDTSLTFNTVVTNPTYDAKEAFTHYNVYNLILTHKVTEKLTYAADVSGSHTSNFPRTTGAAWWYGAAQYLSYAVNENLTGLARVEVWKDDKGVRTGTAGTYTDVTLGVQVKLTDSIIFTPEVRYDHQNNAPFEGGRKDLFTGALSLIVRW